MLFSIFFVTLSRLHLPCQHCCSGMFRYLLLANLDPGQVRQQRCTIIFLILCAGMPGWYSSCTYECAMHVFCLCASLMLATLKFACGDGALELGSADRMCAMHNKTQRCRKCVSRLNPCSESIFRRCLYPFAIMLALVCRHERCLVENAVQLPSHASHLSRTCWCCSVEVEVFADSSVVWLRTLSSCPHTPHTYPAHVGAVLLKLKCIRFTIRPQAFSSSCSLTPAPISL